MTTTIVPTAPSFVAASQIKAGKLASSSRVAISSINLANWLCVYGTKNMGFLSIAEAPASTVPEGSSASGALSRLHDETASRDVDMFVCGKRESTAGSFSFGKDVTGQAVFSSGGSVNEGISITRIDSSKIGYTINSLHTNSYSVYMAAILAYPNYMNKSDTTEPARSSTQPIVSAFEDDAIGHAADGGSMQGVADIIKHAWEQHSRCVFSVRCNIYTTASTNTNLIDTISGTSGYEIKCKGRQLYAEDTTADMYFWADTNGLTMVVSSSKDSFSSSFNYPCNPQKILVDCTQDDSITVYFRATVPASGGSFYSASLSEFTNATVE